MPYVPPGTDVFRVPKKASGFEYRWISDDAERLDGWLRGHGDRPGYKLVRGKNVPETRKVALAHGLPEESVDELTNMIKYGRLILARIPHAEAARRRAEMKSEYRSRFDDQVDAAQDALTRQGIRPKIAELEEFKDRKRFAEREDNPTVSLAGLDIPSSDQPGAAPADSTTE